MKPVLTAAEMRQVEALAAEHGMPALLLMENAGAALATAALGLAGPTGRFFVVCGPGNNGGDGLVAARRLHAAGRSVFVEVLAGPLKAEVARNHGALIASGLTPARIVADVGPGDVAIDAIFGTGLSRAPEGPFVDAIGRLSSWRAAGAKVVAADLPSGLASDSGVPFAPCVSADLTVAFGALKRSHAIEPGASQCGQVEVAEIGIPAAAERALTGPMVGLLEERDVRDRVLRRRADSHKGTHGHVLVIAGSRGKTGAAALVSKAALRSGAGLVTVATRGDALDAVLAHLPEVMGVELPQSGPLGLGDLNALLELADGKQAVVVGPGIARGAETGRLLGALLEELEVPCVLDADALNAIAEDLTMLSRAKGELVLTPHPGEMARLCSKPTAEVNAHRIETARAFAMAHSVVLALKGARTVIARHDGSVFINPTGNAGMATAGTGDVLAGIIGALLGQGLSPEDAALVGAWVHGAAGDRAISQHGQLGLIASDLIEALGAGWVRWNR